MTPVLDALTDREEEVLACVAAGQGRREIAEHLGIRPWTVKAHQANIRRKLDASTLAHAVALYADRKVAT